MRVHPPALVPPSRVTVPPCFLRLCVVPPWMWMGPPSPVYSAETLSPPSIKTPPPSRSSLALLPRPDEMPAFIFMLPPCALWIESLFRRKTNGRRQGSIYFDSPSAGLQHHVPPASFERTITDISRR